MCVRVCLCVCMCVCVCVCMCLRGLAKPPSATGWASRHTTTMQSNIFVAVGVEKEELLLLLAVFSSPPLRAAAEGEAL